MESLNKDAIIAEIQNVLPSGFTVKKQSGYLALIEPIGKHIDLNTANYEAERGELESYINNLIK